MTGERDNWQKEHGIVGGQLKVTEADLLLERSNLSKATGELKLASDEILRLELELKAAQAGSATASQLQIDITDAKKARAAAERDIKKHEATIISLQDSLKDLTDDKFVQSAVRNRGKLTRTYSEQNLDIQDLTEKYEELAFDHENLTSKLNKAITGGGLDNEMEPDVVITTLTKDAQETKSAVRSAAQTLGGEEYYGMKPADLIGTLAHKQQGLSEATHRAATVLNNQEMGDWMPAAQVIDMLIEKLKLSQQQQPPMAFSQRRGEQQQPLSAFSQQHHGERELTEDWNEQEDSYVGEHHVERRERGHEMEMSFDRPNLESKWPAGKAIPDGYRLNQETGKLEKRK